jgi:type VI secretion system protein ImpE
MNAEQALKAGDLPQALESLQASIRKAPADAKLRVFLFQMLAVTGQWQKALNQLDVAAELDNGTLAMAATYRDAVRAELLRERVFAGERDPVIFGEPERWLALLVEALHAGCRGDSERAEPLRARAFDEAPATAGSIDGTRFTWIADADMRLGPVLEGVLNGRYTWLPFCHIRSIRIEEPTDLRDLVWIPARVTWSNGGESIVLIPTRYAGSADIAHPDNCLARRTEWTEVGGAFTGLGQRMLATDAGDFPLLAVREIELEPPPTADDKQVSG